MMIGTIRENLLELEHRAKEMPQELRDFCVLLVQMLAENAGYMSTLKMQLDMLKVMQSDGGLIV